MDQNILNQSAHWADITARNIVRERGEKNLYTCASGITPSGTVHIGNFREIISVELVARALKDLNKNPRFIYSWDDYDTFRKVPSNMPDQEKLNSYLRHPIVDVPDVVGNTESYADYNEKELETVLPLLGITPNYIYQAKEYRKSRYALGIKKALDRREEIITALNKFRSEPLPSTWQPISVFCDSCHKDTTTVLEWDSTENRVSYSCENCGHNETITLETAGNIKLLWRIDWPMRWKEEGVDFEPAGKDHHTEGGSFDTARSIAAIYDHVPPVTFRYDFVRIKGRGGKMSSSQGELISPTDVLEVYTPQIARFLFAGTRHNTEFAISFDLDVLKVYEDYDKCERIYFDKPDFDDPRKVKKWLKQARIYELSQVKDIPKKLPYQISIRHLCNLLQIQAGSIDNVITFLGDVTPEQVPLFKERAQCAWRWITTYAPEEFRFSLRPASAPPVKTPEEILHLVKGLYELIENYMDTDSESQFSTRIYDLMKDFNIDSATFFPHMYNILIEKEKGPRLVPFLFLLGKEKLLTTLGSYQ